LRICRDHLAPNGLAYISYNTRPGWNMRLTLREMLLYHTSQFEQVDEQLGQMHALFEFIREYVDEAIKNTPEGATPEPYHLFLQNESKIFGTLDDKYLFHEFLEEHNLPLYFYEFMREASQCGLRYVGDMDRQFNFREFNLPKSAQVLEKLDPLHKEQYLDFLENRQFRQTLLSLAGNPRELPQDHQVVRQYYFRFGMKPHSQQPNLEPGQPEKFEDERIIVAEDSPIGKAALFYLFDQWPSYFAFDEILARARQRLRGDQAADTAALAGEEEYLAAMLMRFYAKGIVDATVYPLLFPLQAGGHPTANPLALLQAREDSRYISTLACDTLGLNNPAMRKLLALMDGSRSQEDLLDVLQEWADKGYIAAPQTEQQKIVPTRAMMRRLLDNFLQHMAAAGCLSA
jgi:methyltransferase-like protein